MEEVNIHAFPTGSLTITCSTPSEPVLHQMEMLMLCKKIGRALRVRRLGCSKSWESSAAEDALAGMLFAVLSLERTTEPSWLPEVGSVTGFAYTGTLTCMPQ